MADVTPFVHELAISISRGEHPIQIAGHVLRSPLELNLVNPNDLLAKRVIDLVSVQPDLAAFSKAAASFGLKNSAFLEQTWREIKGSQHGSQPTDGMSASTAVNTAPNGAGENLFGQIVIMDHDVQMPENGKSGGLARPGLNTASETKHVFSAPAKPSVLGLDRLAVEKRRERAAELERESKRAKLSHDEDDGTAAFKSALCLPLMQI